MARNINVRLPDSLQKFITAQTSGDGLYDSTSEYIRDLIRRDFERLEALKWQNLESLLRPRLDASEDDFQSITRQDLLSAARARKHAR